MPAKLPEVEKKAKYRDSIDFEGKGRENYGGGIRSGTGSSLFGGMSISSRPSSAFLMLGEAEIGLGNKASEFDVRILTKCIWIPILFSDILKYILKICHVI